MTIVHIYCTISAEILSGRYVCVCVIYIYIAILLCWKVRNIQINHTRMWTL